jgi:hypothetical protein
MQVMVSCLGCCMCLQQSRQLNKQHPIDADTDAEIKTTEQKTPWTTTTTTIVTCNHEELLTIICSHYDNQLHLVSPCIPPALFLVSP